MDERTYARYMSDIAYFSSRLESDPDSKYFIPLCLAYNKMGKYDETLALCRGGVERFPNDCHAKVLLAEAYVYTGNAEAARDLLFEVIPEDPDNYKALKLLGIIYRNMEMPDEAVKYFRGAYFRSPEDSDLIGMIEELGGTVDPTAILEERKRAIENEVVQDDDETKTYFEIEQKIKNAENMMAELVSDSAMLKPAKEGEDNFLQSLISDDDLNKLLAETETAEEKHAKTALPADDADMAVSISEDDFSFEGKSAAKITDVSYDDSSEIIAGAETDGSFEENFDNSTAGTGKSVSDIVSAGEDSNADSDTSESIRLQPLLGGEETDIEVASQRSISVDTDFTKEFDAAPHTDILDKTAHDAGSSVNAEKSAAGYNADDFRNAVSEPPDGDGLRTDEEEDPASVLIKALAGEPSDFDNVDSAEEMADLNSGANVFGPDDNDDLTAILSAADYNTANTSEEIKDNVNAKSISFYSDDSAGEKAYSGSAKESDIFGLEDMVGDDETMLDDQNSSGGSVLSDEKEFVSSESKEEAVPFFQSGIFEEIMDAAGSSAEETSESFDVDSHGGLKALLRLNRDNSETRKEVREKSIKKLEKKLERIKNRNRQ